MKCAKLFILYILIFNLSQITDFQFNDSEAKYLHSDYSNQFLVCADLRSFQSFKFNF